MGLAKRERDRKREREREWCINGGWDKERGGLDWVRLSGESVRGEGVTVVKALVQSMNIVRGEAKVWEQSSMRVWM